MSPARALASVGMTLILGACGTSAAALSGGSLRARPVARGWQLRDDQGRAAPIPPKGAEQTVLYFWMPSCRACHRKLPRMGAVEPELERRHAQLVLVGVLAEEESERAARAVLASWGVDRPFVVDRGGSAWRSSGATTIPAILLLDAQGAVDWVAPRGFSAGDVVCAVANRATGTSGAESASCGGDAVPRSR